MKFKISCHLNENVEQEIECDPQLNTKPDPVAHNATRFVTPSRPNDVPWWWTQLNPILSNVFICNVPVSQCSITSLDDKLNRSRLMSWCSVALQSVLKPIRGDSDYRPNSEYTDDNDDDWRHAKKTQVRETEASQNWDTVTDIRSYRIIAVFLGTKVLQWSAHITHSDTEENRFPQILFWSVFVDYYRQNVVVYQFLLR